MADIELENLTDRELLIRVVDGVNALNDKVSVINNRVRSLEDWRNVILGAVGIVGFAVAIIVPFVLKLVS